MDVHGHTTSTFDHIGIARALQSLRPTELFDVIEHVLDRAMPGATFSTTGLEPRERILVLLRDYLRSMKTKGIV